MNNEEIQALMGKLQAAGLSPEDIADGILWPLFRDGKMSKEDLGTLCSAIGLELDEEFANDDHEEPKAEEGAAAEEEVAPGVSKEEAEELKEVKPGESKEEFKEKVEDVKDGAESESEVKAEEEKDGEDEEEWEEAKKLFKL